MPTLESGMRFAVVSTLPNAAANTGKVFEQGSKLWFSNGSAWVDVTATGGTSPVVFHELALPAATAGRISATAVDDGGKLRVTIVTPDGSVIVLGQDGTFVARNNTGATIPKFSPVYISGSSGQRPTIALARSNADATLPAVGLTLDAINNNSQGRVMFAGVLDGVNTSSFSEGDRLFVSETTAGQLVATAPTAFMQRVCVVTNAHATEGKVLVLIGAVAVQSVAGSVRLTVGTVAPSSPAIGDIWIDTN